MIPWDAWGRTQTHRNERLSALCKKGFGKVPRENGDGPSIGARVGKGYTSLLQGSVTYGGTPPEHLVLRVHLQYAVVLRISRHMRATSKGKEEGEEWKRRT